MQWCRKGRVYSRGCQSTCHMTNSSQGQFVIQPSRYTVNSSHSQLITICHTYVNTIDYFCVYSLSSILCAWGDGGGGHWLVRMECRPAGWSVCQPLLTFPCTIKSRSSLLAPAHPGGSGKMAIKRLWFVCMRTIAQFCIFYFLWPPYGIGQAIIFLPCGFFISSIFFSSPNLSVRRSDVYQWNVLHAAHWKYRTQKIAILAPLHNFVRLYLPYYIFHTKACIDNRKKLVKQQYLLHMSW